MVTMPLLKVFVLSNSLKEIDPSMEGKAEIITGDLSGVIKKLKGRGFKSEVPVKLPLLMFNIINCC